MKILMISASGIQANMTVEYLKAQGFDAFIRGSREYASIITGGDMGRYEILIPEDQWEDAEKTLKKLELQVLKNENANDFALHNEDIKAEFETFTHLKKSIIYCAIAVFVLPIIFNILSLIQMKKYLQKSTGRVKKIFIAMILIILNFTLPVVIIVYDLTWLSFLKKIF